VDTPETGYAITANWVACTDLTFEDAGEHELRS
jgi:hypothetical protein